MILIWTFILAAVVLGEAITTANIVGGVIIIAGITMVSRDVE